MSVARAQMRTNPRDEFSRQEIEDKADAMVAHIERIATESADQSSGEIIMNDVEPDVANLNAALGHGANVLSLSVMFKVEQIGKHSMNTLQKWEGYVESIEDDHFVASIFDVFEKGRGQEQAEIPLKLLNTTERPFLKLGAPFQLIHGFSKTAKGTRTKETIVYFRRYIPKQDNDGRRLASVLRRAAD